LKSEGMKSSELQGWGGGSEILARLPWQEWCVADT